MNGSSVFFSLGAFRPTHHNDIKYVKKQICCVDLCFSFTNISSYSQATVFSNSRVQRSGGPCSGTVGFYWRNGMPDVRRPSSTRLVVESDEDNVVRLTFPLCVVRTIFRLVSNCTSSPLEANPASTSVQAMMCRLWNTQVTEVLSWLSPLGIHLVHVWPWTRLGLVARTDKSMKIIGGDVNAELGSGTGVEHAGVGHNTLNKANCRWLLEQRLIALNTMYWKTLQKQATYRTPKGVEKQLCYVHSWSRDAEANDMIHVESDHWSVMARFVIPEKAKKRPLRSEVTSRGSDDSKRSEAQEEKRTRSTRQLMVSKNATKTLKRKSQK